MDTVKSRIENCFAKISTEKEFCEFFKARIRFFFKCFYFFLIDGTFVYTFSSNLGENLPERQKSAYNNINRLVQ